MKIPVVLKILKIHKWHNNNIAEAVKLTRIENWLSTVAVHPVESSALLASTSALVALNICSLVLRAAC